MLGKGEAARAGSPFVGCFTSRSGRYYVYDVNSNEIIRLPRSSYEVLCSWVQNPGPGVLANVERDTVLKPLCDAGYLSSHRPSYVRPCLTLDDYERLVKRHLSSCIMEVTQACNLKCHYCPYLPINAGRRNHANAYMSWSTASASIDYLLEHSGSSKDVFLTFYGGEPLLAWPLIRRALKYASDRVSQDRLRFHITTNGTLLNPDIASTLFEFGVGIAVSLDGPRAVHDSHRQSSSGEGTFDQAMRGLRLLRDEYGAQSPNLLRVNCVIDEDSDLEELQNFFESSEMPELHDLPCTLLGKSSPPLDSAIVPSIHESGTHDAKGFTVLRERWLADISEGGSDKQVNAFFFELFDQPMLTLYKRPRSMMGESIHPGGMCTPGIRKFLVDVGGRILTCERVSESASVIGNIRGGGIDPKLAIGQLEEISSFLQKRCTNCMFCRVCGGCLSNYTDACGVVSDARILGHCRSAVVRVANDLLTWVEAIEQNPACFDRFESVDLA